MIFKQQTCEHESVDLRCAVESCGAVEPWSRGAIHNTQYMDQQGRAGQGFTTAICRYNTPGFCTQGRVLGCI